MTTDESTVSELLLVGSLCQDFAVNIRLFPMGKTEETVLVWDIAYRLSAYSQFSLYNSGALAEGLSFGQLQTLSFTAKRKTSDSVQDPPRMLAGSHIRLYGLKK